MILSNSLCFLTSVVVALASTSTASPLNGKQDHNDRHSACSDLWKSAPKHLDDLVVNLAEDVSAGSTLNYTSVGSFIPVAIDVGPFCRFSGNITTSDRSSVRFEVWLPPKEQWNGVGRIAESENVITDR
jgi:feruloyl esterase